MEKKELAKGSHSLSLFIIFGVGAIGYFTGYDIIFNKLTPYVLFLSGVFVLISSGLVKETKFIIWLVTCYCLIMLIEIAGVYTGSIFGDYVYGDSLGLKVLNVPLLIGFNWVLIILSSFAIASSIFVRNFFIILTSGLLCVLLDLLMEPVAIKLGFWSWKNNVIPLVNYAAWYIISFCIVTSIVSMKFRLDKKIFWSYYFSVMLFFLILNFR